MIDNNDRQTVRQAPRLDDHGRPYDTWRVAGTSVYDPYPVRPKYRHSDRLTLPPLGSRYRAA